MEREYAPLKSAILAPGTGYQKPSQLLPARVRMESPAIEVMTDLRIVAPVTIEAEADIDTANTRMIVNRVRLLLVVDHQSSVMGLVTATDVLGEKPMQVIQSRGCRHEEVLVRDIMTPQSRLEVIAMGDVLGAKVGNVVQTLKRADRQHALVVDIDENQQQRVRGIFSLTQLARQLGIQIHAYELARTFSEIQAALPR
ncbi:MAG TPA: CBS domain-containing protein [Burkholderiales bacterium]|nr:CBS domain-containing protein [Burkholderiales bacterium]